MKEPIILAIISNLSKNRPGKKANCTHSNAIPYKLDKTITSQIIFGLSASVNFKALIPK